MPHCPCNGVDAGCLSMDQTGENLMEHIEAWQMCVWITDVSWTSTTILNNTKICEFLLWSISSHKKKMANIQFLHDLTSSHTNMCTNAAITKFGWTVSPHSHYSTDPKPSYFHLFCVFFLNTAYSDVRMPRHCRTPCTSGCRGGTATFIAWKHTVLFERGRRLLTKIETIWKNNCTWSIAGLRVLWNVHMPNCK
jgi:hypothetical protein